MASTLIEVATSYTAQTVGAVSTDLFHNVPGPFGGQDCWGHWTVRGTARRDGTGSCKHFYQRVSGIWTNAGLLAFTGTQPAMETETTAAMTTATLGVTASGDDIAMHCTGIAALTINWFITVVTHNVYAEN